MNAVKEATNRKIEEMRGLIVAVSEYLYDHPETAYREFESCDYLASVLETNGFKVDKGIGGVETAFLATPQLSEPKTSPCLAFLAEYDALPKIGHGCGHNQIAAASVGAAIALKDVLDTIDGGMVLVGTPAEEGGGGKVRLIENGVFDDIDAAMMFHPSQYNLPGKGMLGRTKFKMAFHGKTAHASGSPDQGINALDALILTYNGINALRQHLQPDARIHGIITHGGDAPNIIPDYAEALFYVRGGTPAYRDEIFSRVVGCAQASASAMGATVEIEIDGPIIDSMHRNNALERAFETNMNALDVPVDNDPGRMGSSDMGNLSQVLPAIHPYLAIVDEGVPSHSVAFRDATLTDRGKKTLITAAKLLAMTAFDYLSSTDLQTRVRHDFKITEGTL